MCASKHVANHVVLMTLRALQARHQDLYKQRNKQSHTCRQKCLNPDVCNARHQDLYKHKQAHVSQTVLVLMVSCALQARRQDLYNNNT